MMLANLKDWWTAEDAEGFNKRADMYADFFSNIKVLPDLNANELFVLVCGLFWKRANATGALLSLAGGTLAYCAAMAAGFKVADLHQIVIGVTVAGVLMVVGTLAGKQKEAARMDVSSRRTSAAVGQRGAPGSFRDPGALLL